MIVTKDWSTRRPGDAVLDKEGHWWRVVSRGTMGEVVLESPERGRVTIPKPSGPVQAWDPQAPAIEEFRAALGATIIYDTH